MTSIPSAASPPTTTERKWAEAEEFENRFATEQLDISTRLEKLTASLQETASGSELAERTKELHQIATQCESAQDLLNRYTNSLPPFQVRHAQEFLSSSRMRLTHLSALLQPKQRFRFRSRARTPPVSSAESVAAVAAAVAAETKIGCSANTHTEPLPAPVLTVGSSVAPSPSQAGSGVWQDLSDCEISISESLTTSDRIQDLSLHRLERVRFTYLLQSTVVRITHARHCTIVLAPVTSSVFVDHCEECIFYVASHQVRIHNSVSCTFYTHAQSPPIIEDCSSLRFAPYLCGSSFAERALQTLGWSEENQNWSKVVDFRWLKQGPSPNWIVLPPEERRPFDQ
eukprot:CAMPEP_0177630436 /NCGR_PEP_ID=MMETSP0447-20121125/1209_1 /TAXON_ID=0 /ORGANISM="Stygamoeba regulata, Strain BSH-02190019" /LENGTH=341 /DNA_ID=CAMNT_0019131841 /DNA_START=151 /DNA_END=1176 /DNA_ORIENTATION=+